MIESAATMRILRCLALSALIVAQIPSARGIDQAKFMLQRDGYAAAVSNRGVLEAIKSGPHQKIALAFVEWSGFGAQKLVIDWSVIDGVNTARRFGDQIVEAP